MKMKDVKSLITGGVILIAIALYMVFGQEPPTKEEAESEHIAIEQVERATGKKAVTVDFIKAYDGDTVQVEMDGKKEKVRFLMVDTPEMNYQKGEPMPYAKEGLLYTKEKLMNAREVQIVFDSGKERDHYERVLAYVFADGILLQEELLTEGLAAVRFINKGNDTLVDEFKALEEEAKADQKGIWQHQNYLQKDGFHPENVN